MAAEDTTAAAELPRAFENLRRAFGEAVLLMMHCPGWCHLFVGELRARIMPPILLNQSQIVRNSQERTVGFVSWALVDEKTKKELEAGRSRLRPHEWRCGEIVVVCDVVAPSPKLEDKLLAAVAQEKFPGQSAWRLKREANPGLAPVKNESIPTPQPPE